VGGVRLELTGHEIPGDDAGAATVDHHRVDELDAIEQPHTTEADLARRDKLDSSRATNPLRQAADAVEVDTTGMGIDEVVAYLLRLLSSKVSS